MPAATRRWVERTVGSGATIEAVTPLTGATTSYMHLLDIATGSGRVRLVLRHELRPTWLREEPDALSREAANLRLLSGSDVPAPELVAADADGSDCGAPALLMTWLPGRVELRPDDLDGWLERLAAPIRRIHAVTPGDHPWRHEWYGSSIPEPPAWSNQRGLWAAAIEVAAGPPPATDLRFIHRDYHPCNFLWQGGEVSGVVDWASGCAGPGGVDLSHCRGNLQKMYGLEVADQFLDLYQASAGSHSAYHPYWDILQLVENLPRPPRVYRPWAAFGLQGLDKQLMLERTEEYLASVLARLR